MKIQERGCMGMTRDKTRYHSKFKSRDGDFSHVQSFSDAIRETIQMKIKGRFVLRLW